MARAQTGHQITPHPLCATPNVVQYTFQALYVKRPIPLSGLYRPFMDSILYKCTCAKYSKPSKDGEKAKKNKRAHT